MSVQDEQQARTGLHSLVATVMLWDLVSSSRNLDGNTGKSRGQVRTGTVLPGLTWAMREKNPRANTWLSRERLDPS